MKNLSKSQLAHLIVLLGLLIVVPVSVLIIKLSEDRQIEKLLGVIISIWFVLEGLVVIFTKKFVKRREFVEVGAKFAWIYGLICIGFALLIILSL